MDPFTKPTPEPTQPDTKTKINIKSGSVWKGVKLQVIFKWLFKGFEFFLHIRTYRKK